MAATILIIDDNSTHVELMSYLLRAAGHTLFTAVDGAEGIECARRTRPDLVVCDMRLPGLDGYGVAKQLKDDPLLRAVPLIAVTSAAMVGDRDTAMAAGFDGYLTKPIVPKTFVAELEAFLRPSRPPAVATESDEAHTTERAAPAPGMA
jgi:CheY-like chemotaxis protein